MYAYIVVSLLSGARTEEVRALRWEHVHLDADEAETVPHIDVWRAVRTGGDVKTPKSRRSLQLPLVAHRGAPFVSGTRFDAEFRVLGNDGSELLSECVTVTVN